MKPVGLLAASCMSELVRQYGEDANIRSVAIVVEIDVGEYSLFTVASTEDRDWVRIAQLKEGIYAVEDAMDMRMSDDG